MEELLIEKFKLKENREMISFVGAGGKTTTIFALAKELKGLGKKVLVTTTTAIYKPEQVFDYYFLQHIEEDFQAREGTISIFAERLEGGKLRGVAREELDRIYRSNSFDFILIEGDGSKEKPIKAPREGEPIIPDLTTKTIGIIGMDSLGKEINENNVHRSELFLNIVKKKKGEKIEGKDIVKLVVDPKGLFKSSRGDKILLLNKYRRDMKEAIEEIRESLEEKGFKNILIANIEKKEFY